MIGFVSPVRGVGGRVQTALANAEAIRRWRRTIASRLPFVVLESDVRDVVYASWSVPLAAVAHLVPRGVTLRAVEGGTILTVLTYRHGHFGPSLAGPLRRLFPSPLQANWRLYVDTIDGVAPAAPTVLFLANVFDSALYAVGTRLFSDVMLSHHATTFEHRQTGRAWVSRSGGPGSAPSWELRAIEVDDAVLPVAFGSFFPSHADAIRDLCLQDAAIAPLNHPTAMALAHIDLPIDVSAAIPMTVASYIPGSLLRELGAADPPFCFLVPAVRFRALTEELIRTD